MVVKNVVAQLEFNLNSCFWIKVFFNLDCSMRAVMPCGICVHAHTGGRRENALRQPTRSLGAMQRIPITRYSHQPPLSPLRMSTVL